METKLQQELNYTIYSLEQARDSLRWWMDRLKHARTTRHADQARAQCRLTERHIDNLQGRLQVLDLNR